MAVHMRNGIQYGGIPNGTVKGVNPSTVPTTVKQLNQIGTVGNIAPVTIPSAVKFSNGNTLETAIGSVATIETSPAVAAHDAGEYIFYNGQMYKVITAIAVGETLTVDTNIEATSVGTELTQLNNDLTNVITGTLTANAGVSITDAYIGKVGRLATLTVTVSITASKSAYTRLVEIPSGFRPVRQFLRTNYDITVSGAIRSPNNLSAGQSFTVSETYIIG